MCSVNSGLSISRVGDGMDRKFISILRDRSEAAGSFASLNVWTPPRLKASIGARLPAYSLARANILDGRMNVEKALFVLQFAVDRCRVEDIRQPGVYDALRFLESHSAVKWPFDNFRSAMESRRLTMQEKETHWQGLSTALGAIHRCMDGINLH